MKLNTDSAKSIATMVWIVSNIWFWSFIAYKFDDPLARWWLDSPCIFASLTSISLGAKSIWEKK